MLAKDAVRAAWAEKHGEAMFPADIETESGEGRIVCRPRGEPRHEPFPPVRRDSRRHGRGVLGVRRRHRDRAGACSRRVTRRRRFAQRRRALAVADALGVRTDELPVDSDRPRTVSSWFNTTELALRVQTARYKDVIVATTLCEVESR